MFPITENPEYFDINKLKVMGMWPMTFLPAYGMLPYLNRMKTESLVGAELGVLKGENAYALLTECHKTITKLYGVDPYKEYQDIDRYRTQDEMNRYREITLTNMKGIEAFELIEASSLDKKPLDIIKDESLDFVLLDTMQYAEQIEKELEAYYPKVRKGGYIFIHDTYLPEVMKAIKTFRAINKISVPLLNSKNHVGFWQK